MYRKCSVWKTKILEINEFIKAIRLDETTKDYTHTGGSILMLKYPIEVFYTR